MSAALLRSQPALSRASRPEHQPLLFVEVLIVFAIIVVSFGVLAPYGRLVLQKVRLAEIFSHATAMRTDIHERLALDGALGAQSDAAAGSADLAAETIEDAMGIGRNRRSPRPAGSADEEGVDAARPGSLSLASASNEQADALARFQYFPEGGMVTVRGVLGGAKERPFALPLSFAVLAAQPTGNLLWVCGTRMPPPGWVFVYGHGATDMPDELTFSVCRNRTRLR